MELSFNNQLITSVGSVNKRTLLVLPSYRNKEQKIAIGDDKGVITTFTTKRGIYENIFVSDINEGPCTSIALGGEKNEKDQIYVAYGYIVKGYKKKGKEFFKFNTSINEDIKSLFVEDEQIWMTGEYMYHSFNDCKDLNFYMANDRINHMITVNNPNDNKNYHAVLGCQDRTIKILQGGDMYYDCTVNGPVTALSNYSSANKKNRVIYGTSNGIIGQCELDADDITKSWVAESTSSNMKKVTGSINCIASADITQDGVHDIIVGRDDGALEIWGFDINGEPQNIYHKQLTESVSSVDTGHLLSMDPSPDIIYSTYSGKVNTLSFESSQSQSLQRQAHPVASQPPPLFSITSFTAEPAREVKAKNLNKPDSQAKISGIREEIAKLTESVNGARIKYKTVSNDLISQQNQFKINWSFQLTESYYTLSVEVPYPFDMVILKSNIPILLLEENSIQAIVSRTATPDGSLLCSLRCQESVTRLIIKVRSSEGRTGNLECSVIPRVAPKTCQRFNVPLRPLSLHEKVACTATDLEEAKKKKLNFLEITGDFSLNDMNTWLSLLLPDIPPRVASESVISKYKSTYLNTILFCEYSKGRTSFYSDNVSTISTLKDGISKEATNLRININFNLNIIDELSIQVLQTLRPKMDHFFALAKKAELIPSLKELQMAESDDISFLSAEYQDILKNSEQIESENKSSPGDLEFLRTIVIGLFSDVFKLRGKSVTSKLVELNDILSINYNFKDLMNLFNSKISK